MKQSRVKSPDPNPIPWRHNNSIPRYVFLDCFFRHPLAVIILLDLDPYDNSCLFFFEI